MKKSWTHRHKKAGVKGPDLLNGEAIKAYSFVSSSMGVNSSHLHGLFFFLMPGLSACPLLTLFSPSSLSKMTLSTNGCNVTTAVCLGQGGS